MDLRDGVFRIVYEGLKGARHARHLDEVAGRARRDGLQQRLEEEHAEQRDEDAEQRRGPRGRRGLAALAHEAEGGLDELGALLDFGADGESDV